MSKKTMIVAASSIVAILVILILFVWLLTLFKKNYTTYEKVEEKMITAAKNYYKTFPDLLPVSEGKYTLQYSALVEGKFIKPLNELLVDGDSCSAEIEVYKDSIDYDYLPKLYCGDKYRTVELYQKIINDNPVVTEGSGLYADGNGGYYFRGKIENNYVELGVINRGNYEKKALWRIVSIDPNGNIKIKAISGISETSLYDDRYNVKTGDYSGYNDFEESKLKDFLIKKGNEDTETNPEALFTKEEKQKLVPMPLCYGKRKLKETKKDGSVECSKQSEPMYLGTITPYEYMRASTDVNCKKTNDLSCGNYNYLYSGQTTELTITGNASDNYKIYILYGNAFDLSRGNYGRKVYPTTNINSRVLYKKGNGTLENPFKLFSE